MDASPNLVQLARDTADSYGIPQEVFLGLVTQESNWNPNAQSRVGAIGLTQVMPIWATNQKYRESIDMPDLTVQALWDPTTNLKAGAAILAAELERFGDDVPKALAAYNGGPNAVFNALKKANGNWEAAQAFLPAESADYWKKVLGKAQGWVSAIAEAVESSSEEAVQTVKENPIASGGALLVLLGVGLLWALSRGRA